MKRRIVLVLLVLCSGCLCRGPMTPAEESLWVGRVANIIQWMREDADRRQIRSCEVEGTRT